MSKPPMTPTDRKLLAERFGQPVPEHHNLLTAGHLDCPQPVDEPGEEVAWKCHAEGVPSDPIWRHTDRPPLEAPAKEAV